MLKVKVTQSFLTVTPRNVRGIVQARILEWVAYPFSMGSSQPGIELGFPTLQADSLPTELSGKPSGNKTNHQSKNKFLMNIYIPCML